MSLVRQYEKINKFDNNCRFKCSYDILHMNNIRIDMDEIVLLSMETFINSYILYQIKNINFLGISSFLPYFDLKIIEKFGFRYQELPKQETDSIQKLKRFTDNDEIVVLYFDTAKFMKKYKPNMVNFNLLTSGIVLDVNEKSNCITMNSMAEKNKKFVTLPFDELQIARGSEIYPVKPDYRAFVVCKEMSEGCSYDYSEIVFSHLNDMTKKYFEGGKLAVTDDLELCLGVDSYDVVQNYFLDLQSQIEGSKQEDIILSTILNIICKVFRRTLTCSSSTFNREEYGRALGGVAKRYNNVLLAKESDAILKFSKEWRTIVRDLYHVDKYYDKKTVFLHQLVENIKSIKEAEMETIRRINNLSL